MVQRLHYSSHHNLEKIPLSVAGEEKIVQKVLRSKTHQKWFLPQGRCFTFMDYITASPLFSFPAQVRLKVQHHKTRTSPSNLMLLVHRSWCMTCKTPNREQDATDILFIFRINDWLSMVSRPSEPRHKQGICIPQKTFQHHSLSGCWHLLLVTILAMGCCQLMVPERMVPKRMIPESVSCCRALSPPCVCDIKHSSVVHAQNNSCWEQREIAVVVWAVSTFM